MLSNISAWFQDELEIDCPSIERCHRVGRKHADRPRPVKMKLLNYREKANVLKNGHKLKDSDFVSRRTFLYAYEQSEEKIWEATKPFRDKGAIVRLSSDHAFIDKVRYNWDDDTNTLTREGLCPH